MSPFIIFSIVVTLGLVLYYAAMISIDLAAIDKKKGEEAETIEAGTEDDGFEHSVKSVYEDPDTGGFAFGNGLPESEPEPEPEQEQVIQEAEETLHEQVSEESQETNTEEEISEQVEEKEEPTEQVSLTDETEQPVEEPETEEEDDDEDYGVTTIEYTGEEEEKKEELFDVSQAFDPNLTQPKFGVSKFVEPSASPEVQQKANTTNDALESIKRLGNEHKPLILANLMRNKELSEQHNLDTRDEVTKQ